MYVCCIDAFRKVFVITYCYYIIVVVVLIAFNSMQITSWFCLGKGHEQLDNTKCNNFVKIWERKKKEVRAFSKFSKRKKVTMVTSSDKEAECQPPSEKAKSSKRLEIPDWRLQGI